MLTVEKRLNAVAGGDEKLFATKKIYPNLLFNGDDESEFFKRDQWVQLFHGLQNTRPAKSHLRRNF